MPNKICFTCTSYLPAHNPAWNKLQEIADPVFGEYGDWITVLTQGRTCEDVVWTIFFEDILTYEMQYRDVNTALDNAKKALDTLLDCLDRRLNSINKMTIVAWLGWSAEPVVRRARGQTGGEAIYNYFAAELRQRAGRFPFLYLLPLDSSFSAEGVNRCIDSRNYYATRCRLSMVGMRLFAQSVYEIVVRTQKPASKVLVLDCDNTLWGGVIGELGLRGIQLGQDGDGKAFQTFQRVAKAMLLNGTLLAISSKNEEADVWSVFDKHPSMILRREDIVAHRINWQEKDHNLRAIAAELNLGLDSFVFWDDNLIEREKIRFSLPMVVVPEPPSEVVEWPNMLNRLPEFSQFRISREDRKKTQQYRDRASFVNAAKSSEDKTRFLLSINMEPRLLDIDDSTLSRAAQLCSKTNQFNLRLARHDEAAIVRLIAQEATIAFLVNLKDNFGDHGIVGMVIAKTAGPRNVAFLDTFLMSCRVIGRHLESWMFGQLRQRLVSLGYEYLLAEFCQGERNKLVANLLVHYNLSGLNSVETNHNELITKSGILNSIPSGKYFITDLADWDIPYLEIFENES